MSGSQALREGERQEQREQVVLLDDDGHAVGTAAKSEVHGASTPLHLAFSCYLFLPTADGAAREILLTRRALHKRTFPGVWTNSVCGHPLPGETLEASIRRRARDELGVEVVGLRLVLPRFRYRASMHDIEEHEWCPVAVGELAPGADPRPAPDEVADLAVVPWADLVRRVDTDDRLSPWCRQQVAQLQLLGNDPSSWPTGDVTALPTAAPWSRSPH